MRATEMTLIDNINFLRGNYRDVLDEVKKYEDNIDPSIEVLEAKNGSPTLQITTDGQVQYLHSKYDPIQEAKRLVSQYTEVEKYKHVFFYGIGLGYHIDAFLEVFPHVTYTLYEPKPTIFQYFLKTKLLTDLPKHTLKNLFLESSTADSLQFFHQFANTINENILFVALPSYERIFQTQFKEFTVKFKEIINNKRVQFRTNVAFEKRWTINSMINFPEVIETSNVLTDMDTQNFANKPVLLVAAGPSLAEEIENLRYIKENKLAYIFSVGSAINTLIEYGIYPHAACTYDPSELNQVVFKKLKEQKIDSIPLFFGSSVGYETLENYLGPKLHILSNQDTVSSYYLNHVEGIELERINDAPSIAVFMLQLLYKLDCNPIILVGQNLAYKNNFRYSKGIEYEHVTSSISEQELEATIKVESVDGLEILTSPSYNRMRQQLEMYINNFKHVEVINTTTGGANITGTTYIPLTELMKSRLKEPCVDESYYKNCRSNYDIEYIRQQQMTMDSQLKSLEVTIEQLGKLLQDMEKQIERKSEEQLVKLFNRFDKEFKKLVRNKFYAVFLQPMLRVQYELANREMQTVRFEQDIIFKAETIVKVFSNYIGVCRRDLEVILPIYDKLRSQILSDSKKSSLSSL